MCLCLAVCSVTTLLGCVLKGQDGADDFGASGFVDGSLHEVRPIGWLRAGVHVLAAAPLRALRLTAG